MYIRKNVAMQLVKCIGFMLSATEVDNPEVFADVPGYISVNISNW